MFVFSNPERIDYPSPGLCRSGATLGYRPRKTGTLKAVPSNVNIRSKGTGAIERADPDETDLTAMTVIAPQGDLALWAAIDVMGTISAPDGNGLQPAAQDLYG